MILLNRPKIIFLKTRKVGGTSFEIALSKFADEKSIITPITEEDEAIRQNLGFIGPQNCYSDSSKQQLQFWNHISASSAKELLGADMWDQLFKVSIVRNPYDAAISRYFWSEKPKSFSSVEFEAYCLNHKEIFTKNHEQYFVHGKEVIDFYIRYEFIQEDTHTLESLYPEIYGLSALLLKIKAKANYRPRNASVAEMFSQAPKAKELIHTLCQFEIKKFAYECI